MSVEVPSARHPGRAGRGAGERWPHLPELTATRLAVELGSHRAEFVNWGFFDARPWRNYLHAHSFFEACFAHAGHGTFQTSGSVYDVDAGTVFLARPGDVHEIVSSDDDPLGIAFWAFTLAPRTPVAASAPSGPEAPEPEDWTVLRDGSEDLLSAFADPAGPVLSHRTARFPGVLDLLAAEAADPGPAFSAVLRGLAGTLLVDTARSLAGSEVSPVDLGPPRAADPAERLARTMVRYLDDNLSRPIRIRDVAAQVHLSERHAARLFRRSTGTSVHAYVTGRRLLLAAQQLLRPEVTIAEVARTCGYHDVHHFTTAFRRHWGSPPGEFRRGGGTTHLTSTGNQAEQ